MARFGFVGPAYRSQSVTADCQMLMNLYLEKIESGQGKSDAALYCTPGLEKLYDLGKAPLRGEITAQGRTFAVAGVTLWELLPPTATPNKINRGQVVSDGQPVSMAFGPTQVLIASAGNLYCFQLVAGTTTTATGVILAANSLTLLPQYNSTGFGLLGNVLQVQYLLGAFYALILNNLGTTQIQQSVNLDGSGWTGVAQTGVIAFSDNVTAIVENHLQLWVFGPKKIQPYFNSGNFPFSLDVAQGTLIEQGLAAAFSVAKLDNSIFWLGQNERGNGIVWRANGYQPMRISTHAIEYELSTYITIADAVCYAYEEQGHAFYVMHFPTAQKTWVYDAAASAQFGMPIWHQRGFWSVVGGNGQYMQSRAGFHTFNYGIHLVGDPTTGAVYQQSIPVLAADGKSWRFADDFGNAIRRVRRAPHISNEMAWTYHTKLQLDVEVGLGSTLQGFAAPTTFPMLDTSGVLRKFGIGENGILQAPLFPTGDRLTASTIFLNDQTNTSTWKITINAQGVISPVRQAVFVPLYPQSIPFVSFLGDQNYTLQLNNIGGGLAVLQAIPQGIVGRGPIVTLRWSDDGGHTWSAPHDRDCGQAGAYRARVYWPGSGSLGRSRDRVYEIVMSDPYAWRIIDAYLFTDPEDKVPTSRYASEMRKRA